MAELTQSWREVFEVVEHGVIPRGRVCHGVFDDEGEAWRRHAELLRQHPQLATPGVLAVVPRRAEVLEPLAVASTAEEVRR
jgi:hypothetical protein